MYSVLEHCVHLSCALPGFWHGMLCANGHGSVLVWVSVAAAHALSVEGRLPGLQGSVAPSFSGRVVSAQCWRD